MGSSWRDAELGIVKVLHTQGYPPTHQGLHPFFNHSAETPPKALGWGTGKGFKIHHSPEEEGAWYITGSQNHFGCERP